MCFVIIILPKMSISSPYCLNIKILIPPQTYTHLYTVENKLIVPKLLIKALKL